MADSQNFTGQDAAQSVSALGLRWAALRGMLNSPLITAEEQRPLRDELLRELSAIEQDFSDLPSRSTMEISAKLDIAKSALRERIHGGEAWLVDLIESIQSDLHSVAHKPVAATTATTGRSPANLSRPQHQRSDDTGSSSSSPSSATSTSSETTTSSAA
ncbi:hypothetical protein [Microvirga lotononidis]|uniref:Uncharacterized protein n=1 Tax=Microvirga lotononidis TaxID=864069 RepID=I4YSM4_9HYPH|nr:hypothetical protein [Microvirga lotononidis]EIM26966.1 hypothetical protein MicloDRAFT_00035190 [Microvirga lotononidis]WQO28841.1 hypothetical protein U0023_07140 [Microvirga lotononidis]